MNQDQVNQARTQKQSFLKTEIIEKGYDGAQFGEYLNSVRPGGGGNIDVWSFEELRDLVYKFKSLALQQPDPVVDNSGFGWNSTGNAGAQNSAQTAQSDNPFDSFQSIPMTDSAFHMQRDKVETKALPDLRGQRTGHSGTNPQKFVYGSDIMSAYDYPEESKTNKSAAGKPQEKQPDKSDEEKRPRIDSQDIRLDQEEVFSEMMPVRVTEATQLSTAKNAEVHVLGYEQVKEGLFSGKHIQYHIRTVPFGWEVKRRFSDFVWLRTTLLKLHPGVMVPPIPKKTKNYKAGFMRRRVYFFGRFLNAIMLNDELRTDKYFMAFLSSGNDNVFKGLKKDADKKPRIGKLSEVTMASGQAPLEINKDLKFFAAGFMDLCSGVDPIYEKIKKFSRQLMTEFEQVSNTMYNLADCYAHLHGLASNYNKTCQVGKSHHLENIYLTMNNMMATWAEQTIVHSENIQKYVDNFYKYTEYENDVWKELLDFRMKYGLDYIAKKKDLIMKKEKLFAHKDASKWGIPRELQTPEILNDKPRAFDAMMPKESAAVKEVQTSFAFFNAMCFNQLDQALQERCRQYTKNFMEYGKAQSDVMQQIQMKWHEQLSKVGETKVLLSAAGAEIKSKATQKSKVDQSTVDFEDD